MANTTDSISLLLEKLEALHNRQQAFSAEINDLREAILRLKTEETPPPATETAYIQPNTSFSIPPAKEAETAPPIVTTTPDAAPAAPAPAAVPPIPVEPAPLPYQLPDLPAEKSNLEKFIGENLINKIGIAITVIGIAIGAKYAIDNELISPLTRIVLGYIMGIGLLVFAAKLKHKYENFSAVLLSGAMAIFYFITYAAYSFYDLMPQVAAFGLMVVFTAFTVFASVTYNKQVIAHIGLVGAYAVPFLLSEGSGKVVILFTYMAIINAGILVIAFKRYWKPLYYVSFGLTWVMFCGWFFAKYTLTGHFVIALTFLSIFFIIFYLTFLAYKLLQKEKFEVEDVLFLLFNSFIFYGVGYAIFREHETGSQLLGAFTLLNAIIHFGVSVLIFTKKLSDKNLFYLVSGMVLVFITIAIPVQLNGNWVTLLWAGEAALLYWIGRTKQIPVYEKISYPLMLLAFGSIVQDWLQLYNRYNPAAPETKITPLLNIPFLTSLFVIAAFGHITMLSRKRHPAAEHAGEKDLRQLMSFVIPTLFIATLYFALRMEISLYYTQQLMDGYQRLNAPGNKSAQITWLSAISYFKTIWIINYSLLFIALLAWVNNRKIKNVPLAFITLGLLTAAIALYLTQGLLTLSNLRENYLDKNLQKISAPNFFYIGIRYITYAFAAFAFISIHNTLKQDFLKRNFKTAFDLMLHTAVIWIASSELINWLDIAHSQDAYKLGLSILWGVYALFLIALGIWKKNQPLRIGAIVLFGITLLKLFFYDIAQLDTIAKTIVFVSLGILLLIISFLYNKYKHIISDEAKN